MAYQEHSYPTLGKGLDLRSAVDATDLGFAIDLMNVQFDTRGAVFQRDGYARWSLADLDKEGNSIDSHYESDGTRHLLVGAGGNVGSPGASDGELAAYGPSGNEVATVGSLSTGAPFDFQRHGSPGTEETFIGNGLGPLHMYDGSSFKPLNDAPMAGALAVTSPSNRLVATGFRTNAGGPTDTPGGDHALTNPSTVWFSDAGDPDTWGANNYVQLTPGDGEQIQAALSWGSYVIVFKETKFFVFTGESQDSSGQPVFEYYAVDTGHGAIAPNAVTGNEHGVFFWDRSGGLMATEGGKPVSLSERIAPIYGSGDLPFWSGGRLNWDAAGQIAVNTVGERIYVSIATEPTPPSGLIENDRILVYDLEEGWWSVFSIPAEDITDHEAIPPEGDAPFFVQGVGVFDSSADYTNDVGHPIVSHWQSGWNNFNNPREKKVRQSKLWGTGLFSYEFGIDFLASDARANVALGVHDFTQPLWYDGTDPTHLWGDGTDSDNLWGLISSTGSIAGHIVRPGARTGTYLNVKFSNNVLNQFWSVHACDLHEAAIRQPSVAVHTADGSTN